MRSTVRDIMLFIVTNKKGDGQKKDKGYYSSFLLPAEVSKNFEGQVFVLDIDDPRNQDFCKGKKGCQLWAFPVDQKYAPEQFDAYAEKARRVLPDEVCCVVPYVSAEADPDMVAHLADPFLEDTPFLNAPAGLTICGSKASLQTTRKDPAAAHIAPYFLPNILVHTVAEYEKVKQDFHQDVVARVPCSTEGIGVFIKDEIEAAGVDHLLGDHPEGLLLTPYFPTQKTGDTRIYAFADMQGNVSVFDQGVKRIAPPGKYAKCNVSAGGSWEVLSLTDTQKEIATQVAAYYAKTYGLHWFGFDFFSLPTGEKAQQIGTQSYRHVVSEINFSPDGLNTIAGGVEKAGGLFLQFAKGALRAQEKTRQTVAVSVDQQASQDQGRGSLIGMIIGAQKPQPALVKSAKMI